RTDSLAIAWLLHSFAVQCYLAYTMIFDANLTMHEPANSRWETFWLAFGAVATTMTTLIGGNFALLATGWFSPAREEIR
ncbi:MAG: hypothetical protein KDA96_21610, partial [Planctomycetaceae bacterium]|nr:hypothetical protein [Planctomycetaceae bacterium]